MNKKIFAIAIITLVLDQLAKGFLELSFKLNESIPIINNFFYITNCHNNGAAWSILPNARILFIVLSFIALIIIYRYIYLFKTNFRNNLAFGLLIGGISGNLLDRILFGYVRDFFDFYLFKYDYPVFNIADIAIVIGVILLLIAIIKKEDVEVANKSRKR